MGEAIGENRLWAGGSGRAGDWMESGELEVVMGSADDSAVGVGVGKAEERRNAAPHLARLRAGEVGCWDDMVGMIGWCGLES